MTLSPATSRRLVRSPTYATGALVLLAALATILTALGFEHLGGYVPCELCLRQRWAYYIGIPVLFVGLVLLAAGQTRAAGLIMMAVGLGFLVNAGLGVHQVGVELGYWAGPTTCSGNALQPLGASGSGDLLKDLQSARVARCDAPNWHFLGLSFAGWNVIVSLMLFAGALKAAYEAIGARSERI
jgi:disulfide bond formation protein DsbB